MRRVLGVFNVSDVCQSHLKTFNYLNVFFYRLNITVRSSRTPYRFHSLHPSSSRKRSVQKGSKKTALSFTHSAALRSAPFVHSFADFLHILGSSQGGLCESGARSNASTVSPVASYICFAVALRFVVCLFPQAGPSLQ